MTTAGSNVNKGSRTKDPTHDLLMGVQNAGPFNYTNAVEILGSADKATRAIKQLKDAGIISRISTKERKSYGIHDKDQRKVYYVLTEASWAQKEWNQVSKTIESIITDWKSGNGDSQALIDAVLSVIGLPLELTLQPSAMHMARYRNKSDIDTLLGFYKILNSESLDNDYFKRIKLMRFMLECLSQTHSIGPTQRENLAPAFRGICEDALKKMKDSSENGINSNSPMALAFLAFKAMLALYDDNVMAWIEKNIFSMIEDIKEMDDAHMRNAITGLSVFKRFIRVYRERYPKGFKTANRSEPALKILETILDGETGSMLRDLLVGIRNEILTEILAPDNDAE